MTKKLLSIVLLCSWSFVAANHTLRAETLLQDARAPTNISPQKQTALSRTDREFLDDLERRAVNYFIEHADSRTGLVLDRTHTDGTTYQPGSNNYNIASIAATGFGLTALCIGAERGWIERREAGRRIRLTLRFFATEAAHNHGWFLHWMDATTGARRWNSETSSIDTALLLAGVLTARGYFREDREIQRLATLIYERVDFQWMLGGHSSILSHGWRPETGFLRARWNAYSEHLILNLLAVGSPTHPITPRSWLAWQRERITFAGYTYITGGPLFIHQYSHAWVDFRGREETAYPHTSFFQNSVDATRAHRKFCLNLKNEFPGYADDVWGITASDSRKGYVAWGGPPRDPAIDGSVVPCAAGGSLMLTPDIALPALKAMRARFGERVYGRYGFADAFHPTDGWVNPDVIGINVGITLLSAENLQTGNVWRWFMRNREITEAMNKVGLRLSRTPARSRPRSSRRNNFTTQ